MEKQRFSSTGEYLAVCGSDGRLRIWETATNILKQEYVSSSHLSAMCTCIEWASSVSQNNKKKKRKRTVQGEVIAIGTAVGSILFYGLTEAKVLAQSSESHSGKVTGLAWNSTSTDLYSCGDDGFIIIWDPETTNIVSRWKGGKGGLTGLRVHTNDKYLITASKTISLWNLETKTVISSFTGHPGYIDQIEVIPSTETYFITMSHSERNLRIWTTLEKNSTAVLSVSEPPSTFHVLSSKSGDISVAVITSKGTLHVFQHRLNGSLKKPLTPLSTLKILDASDNSKVVPILTGFAAKEDDVTILAGYGSWTKLCFEKFGINALKKLDSVEREFNQRRKAGKKFATEQRTEVPNDVKHLQPGTTEVTSKSGKKRKNVEETIPEIIDPGELPMEERLTNLTIDVPTTSATPDGSNLAHVLSQGLHSRDTRILHSVLSRWDEEIVAKTVRSLPVQLVVPLLNEVKVLLAGKAQMNHSILKWLKSIFQIHSAYLMSCTLSEEMLTPFMSLLLTREALYPQMCQLKGKLELMKGNIKAKKYCSENTDEALLVFQDESSGDDDDEDDGIMPSESEDFLGSDDLGVEDEDDNSGSEESNSDAEAGSDDEDSHEEEIDTKEVSSTSKPKSIGKSKPVEEESENEFMDSD